MRHERVAFVAPAKERQKAVWLAMGVPEPLATELAWLPTAAALFTLTALAEHTGQPLAAVAAVYWALQRGDAREKS
jgi:NAD-specific glutamate dehydrogenase